MLLRILNIIVVLGYLCFAHTVFATTFTLKQTFSDPNPDAFELFGNAVAISGNKILIGASSDSTNGIDAGQAFLFDTTTGNLLQTFNDPNPGSFDFFGNAVSVSGNNVLIGAVADDTNGFNAGQAFLFDATTGNLLQTFNDPDPDEADFFGDAVAISGNNVLIGSAFDNTNGVDAGQAFLFDATTGNLLQTFNDPNPGESDLFGNAVSISGNHVLIGAVADDTNGINTGQAFLFDTTTGGLLQTFNDPNPDESDLFGNAVSISGNNVLIGAAADDTNGTNAGQAFLFDATTGDLLQIFNDPNPGEFDFFGDALSISDNNVLIGAIFDSTNGFDAGQAFLFDVTTGDLLQTFNDPNPSESDFFGNAVAISSSNVLIGAFEDDINGANSIGQAFLFTKVDAPATWILLVLGLFMLHFVRKTSKAAVV